MNGNKLDGLSVIKCFQVNFFLDLRFILVPPLQIPAMKLRDACSFERIADKPTKHIKKQKHQFADKGPYNQSYGFSTSHVQKLRVGP